MTTAQATRTRRTLKIMYDESPENPRSWNPIGTLYSGHYHMGRQTWTRDDEALSVTPHEDLRGESVALRVDVPPSYLDRYAGDAFIVASKDDLRAEYGDDWREHLDEARALLTACGREWRNWADGNVFGFIVTTEHECADTPGEWHEDDSESVWGFIADGIDDLREQLRGSVPDDLLDTLDSFDGGYPIAASATV